MSKLQPGVSAIGTSKKVISGGNSVASRAGSHAGRGFRYQDAVAAHLAIGGWAGLLPYGLVIPEGEDDIELRTTSGRVLAQVKSRRENQRAFSVADVVGFLTKLWNSGGGQANDSFILILERSFSGVSLLEGSLSLGELPDVVGALPDSTAPHLIDRTTIEILPNPRGKARAAVTARRSCSVLEADAYFGSILSRAGQLSDDNGLRKPGEFLGLSLSDVEGEVNRLAPLFTSERIQAALSRGLCEAVDFALPLEDQNFFSGVDVQPGHVVAGLLVERTALRDEVTGALKQRRIVLLRGPSGAGKSALQWDAAHSLRHAVRWFRVRHLSAEDIGDLVMLANSCGASHQAPVGFLLDNVSAGLMDGWNALAREVATNPGLTLLASIREEDIYPLTERSKAFEVSVRATSEFAEQFWCELRDRGLTSWTNWQEPWSQSNDLLLEYSHILTQGSRLAETLRQQVAARVADTVRHAELEVLRIAAAITSVGARVDVSKLPTVLHRSPVEVGSALPRLVNEHLLRDLGDGSIGGAHELRSRYLLVETNHVSTNTEMQTFLLALDAVLVSDLGIFLARALGLYPALEESLLDALATKLGEKPSVRLLTTILTGLGERQIEQGVDLWLKSPEFALVPEHLETAAVLFGIAGNEMPTLFADSPIAPAAALLTEIKSKSEVNHLRGRLLQRLPETCLQSMLGDANGVAPLNALLTAHVGHALAPGFREALLHTSPDLLSSDLAQVGELLGTVHLLDSGIAHHWVDRVGAEALLARVGRDVPWATAATISKEPEGVAVASDLRVVPNRYQHSPHDDVVALCDLLLALCPAADLAISRAMAGPDVVAGFNGANIADKRIHRCNLPPSSLPKWNHRWSEAIRQRQAPPSYGAFLIGAVTQLEKVNLALFDFLDGELRGARDIAALDALGEVHTWSRSVRPTRIPWSADGVKQSERDSQLQPILFDCSADLLRKLDGLPQNALSFFDWLGRLQKRIRESIEQEPWHLMPEEHGGKRPLEQLRELVEDIIAMAGEGMQRNMNPVALYRSLHIPKGRALAEARLSAKKKSRRLKKNVEDELRRSFSRVQPGTRVYVSPSSGESTIWPMLDVLVTVRLDRIQDWIATVSDGWSKWRGLVANTISLTVMPVVNGMHLPMCAMSGNDYPIPAEERAREWIVQEELLPMPEAATSMWRTFTEAAIELAVFESQGLGLDDRPAVERVSKADLLARFMASKAAINETLPPLLRDMANTLAAMVREQPHLLLECQLRVLSQEITPVAEVLVDAQYACYSVDLGMAPEDVWESSAAEDHRLEPI